MTRAPIRRPPRPRVYLLGLAVALSLGATLALAAVQHLAVGGSEWQELIRYLPYPAYLGLPVLALGFSMFMGWHSRLASLAALTLTLVVTMDLHWHMRPPPPAAAAAGRPTLRLMTYNIKAYRAVERAGGFDPLAREVALRKPDVLLLQDASTAKGEPMWGADEPVFGLPHVFIAQQYVIASRLPLHGCRLCQTRPGYLAYLTCTVTVEGRPLNLVTAHFVSPRPGLMATRRLGLEGVDGWRENFRLRLSQSRALAADLQEWPRPLIVAGDLNAPDASPVLRSLSALDLQDAFAEAGTGYGYTYGESLRPGFAFLRIDHILVSPQVEVVDAFVGNAGTSDHRPVIADLRLRD